MGLPGKFSNALMNVTPIQKDTSQLTGAAPLPGPPAVPGNGFFRLATAQRWLGVFGHSDLPVNWMVEVKLPNPEEPDDISKWEEYRWLTVTAEKDIVDSPDIPLPAGTIIIVKTTLVANSNPRCQVGTRMLNERSS